MRISIITINFNDKQGLERTINSTICQTYENKEYIIIDGASNDGSLEILHEYSNYITKWVSEPDTGVYNAMNKGIRLATGDYCIFMNAGDVFYDPKTLQKAHYYLETHKDIYNGNAIYLKDGRIMWYRKCHKDTSIRHFFHSSICHQATFIKTSLLKNYMYDETLRMVSDWKFWLQAICIDHATYEAINTDVCCFDMGGLTYKQKDLGERERDVVIKSLFSESEIISIKKQAGKRSNLKYIFEGTQKRFWLYYARLFKIAQVRNVI